MSYALNIGSGYMPGGLSQNHVPHGDEEPELPEERDDEACTWCGERACVCDEGISDEDLWELD